ncbi:urease accessory protein UreD [Azorhizobium oxalatiphilum]|uniref:Urease accessory protein UreD n=1 Tax=Azorhizobium oxalatiphilum TaxID=980631 RepID=A0A917FDZ7_9HYPH|nr:urease accessory protein UreD [Azorhizobium oxalatiphilum]GGF72255.1 urease accessory protein UreD [Azorhizobium oxalatiphilum]
MTTTGSDPRRQRAIGTVRLGVTAIAGQTRVADVAEAGSMRVRMPRTGGTMLEGVFVNTAGGVACGDHFTIGVDASADARVVLATPAAEKIYRSDGDTARIDVHLTAQEGAHLHWLPQETILFDSARLKRRFTVELDPTAHFLAFEALALGRVARGEVMNSGHLEDHWQVKRGGGLVYADALRLTGPIGELLRRPSVANGNRALATLLYVAPDAEARLDEARALMEGARSECGASAWNGLLAARWLAPDIDTLRRDAVAFLTAFRGVEMPRVWAL